MARIGFAGCKYTTRDCLEHLLRTGFEVDALVTIAPATAAANAVAGYDDLRELAHERGIDLHVASRYDLRGDADEEFFRRAELDVLLVIGWERLIPSSVLDSLTRGAFGMHGSPRGLPFGRGRSPLNWSLIRGEKQFRTSLFRYEAGIDEGGIVDTLTFDINEFDTCRTLHYKNRIAMNLLLERHLPRILSGTAEARPQPPGRATYFPRRRPEDGGIDWSLASRVIYDFVRALTRPYPGAFTHVEDSRVQVWACQPFGEFLDSRYPPGTIREVFSDGPLLVETGDYPLLVTDYEMTDARQLSPGDCFRSVDFRDSLARIVQRYPDFVQPDQYEIPAPETFAGARD